MAPTATDYSHGLRRMWWVPLLTVLVGVGLGLWSSTDVRPTAVTTGNALFTFQINDPGDDSAGSARSAEATVAQSRLAGYVQIARSSQQIRETLLAADTDEPPTTFSPAGGFKDGAAAALIDIAPNAPGLVEIRVKNADLTQEESDQLVDDLSREVVRQVIATDVQQVTPSLQPDALITEPQVDEEPASRVMKLALPVLLLLTLGLGLVYLLVWRQGRIYARHDIEERVGARVLGDLTGRVADAPAIALALGRGREGGTTALLIPASPGPSHDTSGVGQALASAGRGLGLTVTRAPVGVGTSSQGTAAAVGVAARRAELSESPAASLTLIDAPAGLDADSLRAAGSVDIVALVVEYGMTSYHDLTVSGQTLAEATAAEIAVIGVSRFPKA